MSNKKTGAAKNASIPKPTQTRKKKKQAGAQSGSYRAAPVAMGRMLTGTFNPQIRSAPRDGGRLCTVIRSPSSGELVSDLLANSTGTFLAVVNQGINPGNSFLFPWLAGEAAGFEAYRFRKLHFRYETEAASTQPGTAMMAYDPNSQDTIPATKQEAMELAAHCRTPPWQPIRFEIPAKERSFLGPERYIRLGAVPSGADSKTFDVGTFFMFYSGTSSATNLGELYVDYEVELYGQQPSLTNRTLSASLTLVGAGSVSRAAPFGTAPTSTGNLQVTAASATLTFNSVGRYLVAYTHAGTVFTDTEPTLTGTASATNLYGYFGHTTAATNAGGAFQVVVSLVGQTVILDYTASATTITTTGYRIARWQAT